MEASLALFLPLIGGYLLASHYTVLKYRLARFDGHRFYFSIAYYGLLLFLVSAVGFGLLYWGLNSYCWFQRGETWAVANIGPLFKGADASSQLAFCLVCAGTIPLGRLAPPVMNRIFESSVHAAAWKAVATDQVEELLMEALNLTKAISITLSTGKVYVGFVLMTPEPHSNRRSIAILPLMSGYRNDEHRVIFTTFYDKIYQQSDVDEDDFKLVLPIDKMTALAFFDVATYARFGQQAAADVDNGTATDSLETQEG